jgi:uncharacterized protein
MSPAALDIHVIPRAKKTAIAGERDGAVLIRLAAPPVEGAANDALIEFLAATLGLPRRSIHIVSGEHSRRKRIVIDGMTPEQVHAILRR